MPESRTTVRSHSAASSTHASGRSALLRPFFLPSHQHCFLPHSCSAGCRWLWLAAQRLPWSPEAHATFPPAFKEAARTLLLAAHRGATLAASDASGAAGAGDGAAAAGDRSAGSSDGAAGAGGSAAGGGGSAAGAGDSKAGAGALHLGCLPRELLHGILAHAAYPLSEWAPQMEDGSWLEEVQAWEPLDSEGAYDDGYGYGDGDDSDSDFW